MIGALEPSQPAMMRARMRTYSSQSASMTGSMALQLVRRGGSRSSWAEWPSQMIEVADALRVPSGVGEGQVAGAGQAQDGEALEAEAVDHGVEVAAGGVDREVDGVALRHAHAAAVVADDADVARQTFVGGAAANDLPLHLEVAGREDGRNDQRQPFAHRPVGDAHPV